MEETKTEGKAKGGSSKKSNTDWREIGIKVGAFAATAFLGGVASAAGARTFNAATDSFRNKRSADDTNVVSISRAI